MKLNEALNRGFNLLAVSMLGLTGVAFAAEIFLENDWADKLDDIGLAVLATVAIVWYLTGSRRYARSAVPVVLTILGLLNKIAAVIIEHKDKDALGDDMGGVILFIFAAILVVYQYRKTQKLIATNLGA